MSDVIDNEKKQRFELVEDGKMAFADYSVSENVVTLPHVEADPALRGKGSAGRLMAGLLALVRERGMKVRPVCGYAVAFIQRKPEYQDLLE